MRLPDRFVGQPHRLADCYVVRALYSTLLYAHAQDGVRLIAAVDDELSVLQVLDNMHLILTGSS